VSGDFLNFGDIDLGGEEFATDFDWWWGLGGVDGFGGAFGESKDLVAGQFGEQPRLVVIF
jgi:hypothetical protein